MKVFGVDVSGFEEKGEVELMESGILFPYKIDRWDKFSKNLRFCPKRDEECEELVSLLNNGSRKEIYWVVVEGNCPQSMCPMDDEWLFVGFSSRGSILKSVISSEDYAEKLKEVLESFRKGDYVLKSKPVDCLLDDCNRSFQDYGDMLVHLSEEHGIYPNGETIREKVEKRNKEGG